MGVVEAAEIEPVKIETQPIGKSDIEKEIIRVFGHQAKEALCIAKMESGYRPTAANHNTNGTWDLGVFQINDVHRMSWNDRMDPHKNIAKAKEIRDSWGNWHAWSARHKCGL